MIYNIHTYNTILTATCDLTDISFSIKDKKPKLRRWTLLDYNYRCPVTALQPGFMCAEEHHMKTRIILACKSVPLSQWLKRGSYRMTEICKSVDLWHQTSGSHFASAALFCGQRTKKYIKKSHRGSNCTQRSSVKAAHTQIKADPV